MPDLEQLEREKYLHVWTHLGYRAQCDGEPVVVMAHVLMHCIMGESIIDWGCGTGRCAAAFQRFGLRVTCFDIADNCLDRDVQLPLIVGTLWNPPAELSADYAFCTDVMEHIPPDKVEASLDAIAARTQKAAFFQIDTAVDQWGDRLSPPQRLHLTVQPKDWWEAQLSTRWGSVEWYPGAYTRAGFLCRQPL